MTTVKSEIVKAPEPAMRQRHTRIIATLGPACASSEQIGELICAGTDIFRINASHADVETQAHYIEMVRESSSDCDVHIGILLDLQGPKIRLGVFQKGSICLRKDESFWITTQEIVGTEAGVSTTYRNFASDVRAGDRVLLADGAVEPMVLQSDGTRTECRVIRGGVISELPIIAKIERPAAWQRIDEIVSVCDGVMVARGDLAVEVSMEQVPHIQKTVIEKARQQNRFVITATQMLESMIHSPVPTRAEVSDITNAIYDGTDALMLSGETARGKYPADAVRTMSEIASVAELHSPTYQSQAADKNRITYAEVLADAACRVASGGEVEAIVVFTVTGRTAHLIAARRPIVPILAFASTEPVARQLSAWYGVVALLAPSFQTLEQMTEYMDREIRERSWVRPGSHVLFVAGDRVGKSGATNMLKVHTVFG